MRVQHWEVYVERGRATGLTPWAVVEHGKSKIHAIYGNVVIIAVPSYTGSSSHVDRPKFVLHCTGVLRQSGSVIYIEEKQGG